MSWDDDDFDFDDLTPEENERLEREQREKHDKQRKHPLYLKAKEIFKIVHTLLETAGDNDRKMYLETLRNSAMMLAPKVAGALGSESWLVCMQNAAIIREHASYLLVSNHMLNHLGGTPGEYSKMFRREMEEFRTLFVEWVSTFKDLQDEGVEDEWGLFRR